MRRHIVGEAHEASHVTAEAEQQVNWNAHHAHRSVAALDRAERQRRRAHLRGPHRRAYDRLALLDGAVVARLEALVLISVLMCLRDDRVHWSHPPQRRVHATVVRFHDLAGKGKPGKRASRF